MNELSAKTNDKLSDRENYILSQLNLDTTETIELDLEVIQGLNVICKEKNINFDELVNLILVEAVMDIEKDKFRNEENENEEIIDMYDFHKLEELIENNKKYLVATYNDPVVLLPIDDYEKIKESIESLKKV